MSEREPQSDTMPGLGHSTPAHQRKRDEWSPPSSDPTLADDISEARLVHKLLRLGGTIPDDRWEKIDAMLDRLLAREALKERDLLRIAQVQAARERIVVAATGRVLDTLAPRVPDGQASNVASVVIVRAADGVEAESIAEGPSEAEDGGAPIAILPGNGRELTE